MFKKSIAAIVTVVPLVLGAGAVTATPAHADTYGYVDNYEWHHFSIGDGKNYVEELFDTRGYTKSAHGYVWVKRYAAIGRYSHVDVKYVWTGYRWVVKNAWRYY